MADNQHVSLLLRSKTVFKQLAARFAGVCESDSLDVAALLGRKPVDLHTPELQRFLAGKVILVTGAGGSIGSEICRQSMRFCPAKLILLDRAEHALFEIDRQLRHQWIGAEPVPVLADIFDPSPIAQIFEQ